MGHIARYAPQIRSVPPQTGDAHLGQSVFGQSPDYSQEDCWVRFPETITKDVDTFYIYSTVYVDSSFEEGSTDYATLDNPEMLLGAYGEYVTNASVYEDSTNLFMPYYRQSGMRYAAEVSKKTGDIDSALSGLSYDDISTALDYYFENCNNGRPFIIAGHSQGSAMVRYVLKNYFKEHTDYYKRMIAAYAIGYSITKEDLEAYPYLKFAAGESDTGVIVSWNTEGPKNVEENAPNAVILPNAISINPLNWKLDDTYAPASENLGSLMLNEEASDYEITDVGADALVDSEDMLAVENVLVNKKEIPEELKDELILDKENYESMTSDESNFELSQYLIARNGMEEAINKSSFYKPGGKMEDALIAAREKAEEKLAKLKKEYGL